MMEAILLKPRKTQTDENLVIFDELVAGILTTELFVPLFVGNWTKFSPLSYLISNYKFPRKNGEMKANMLHFLKGANPELLRLVEFYEDDSIEIELV